MLLTVDQWCWLLPRIACRSSICYGSSVCPLCSSCPVDNVYVQWWLFWRIKGKIIRTVLYCTNGTLIPLYVVFACLFPVLYLYWVSVCLFSCTALFVSISQVIGCEDRLRNDVLCVGWCVKLYSLTHSPVPSWTIISTDILSVLTG